MCAIFRAPGANDICTQTSDRKTSEKGALEKPNSRRTDIKLDLRERYEN
jgi:hypothetical protein